jgi:hypothetical protein
MSSMGAWLVAEQLDRFREFVRQEIADAVTREGGLRIRKSQGLFEAYRAEQA